MGRKHRKVLHDRLTNLFIGLLSGDFGAFLAGELHDLLDRSVRKRRVRKQE